MKKIITILCFSILAQVTYAQLYVGLNVAPSVATGGTTLETIGLYNYSQSLNSISIIEEKASFGGGLFFGGTVGYRFHQNVAFELNVGYHLNNKITTMDSYVNGSYDYEFSTQSLSFRPSIILTVLENNQREFYTKLGAVYSTADFTLNIDGSTGTRFNSEQMFYAGKGLGSQIALGVNWKLSSNLCLQSELFLINLALTPESSELLRYDIGGVSQLDTMTTRRKNTEYKDEIVVTASTGDNQPNQELRFKIPFNGVGLNLGLRLDLGKGRKSESPKSM